MKASHMLGAALFCLTTRAIRHANPKGNSNNNNNKNTTAPPKVIFDTDFNTIGDDGQAFAMAAQLHAAGAIDLLGITVVAGTQHLDQGVRDALRAVERMGLAVGVYPGAEAPLLHTYAAYQLERAAFGNTTRYVVGLDVTDTVAVSNATYDRVAGHEPATAVTALSGGVQRWPYVYDTVALASLCDGSLDLDVRSLCVDVNCDFSAEYGRGLVWEEDPYPGLGLVGVSSVLFGIDNTSFFELYVDLLTRPISGAE